MSLFISCYTLFFFLSQDIVGYKQKELSFLDDNSFLSGLLDSNQRPRAPQTCALPTAPNPDSFSSKPLQRYILLRICANIVSLF